MYIKVTTVTGSFEFCFSSQKPLWLMIPFPNFCLGLLGSFCPFGLAGWLSSLYRPGSHVCQVRARHEAARGAWASKWRGLTTVHSQALKLLRQGGQLQAQAQSLAQWKPLVGSDAPQAVAAGTRVWRGEHSGAWKLGGARNHRAPKRVSHPWLEEPLGFGSLNGCSLFSPSHRLQLLWGVLGKGDGFNPFCVTVLSVPAAILRVLSFCLASRESEVCGQLDGEQGREKLYWGK